MRLFLRRILNRKAETTRAERMSHSLLARPLDKVLWQPAEDVVLVRVKDARQSEAVQVDVAD